MPFIDANLGGAPRQRRFNQAIRPILDRVGLSASDVMANDIEVDGGVLRVTVFERNEHGEKYTSGDSTCYVRYGKEIELTSEEAKELNGILTVCS